MLVKRGSASRRDGRGTSRGKMVQPVGTSMVLLTAAVNQLVT
jgi:hypothetical protein